MYNRSLPCFPAKRLERNGQRLWLVPERSESRIGRLPILDIIVGNPDDLATLNVSEWNETKNLD